MFIDCNRNFLLTTLLLAGILFSANSKAQGQKFRDSVWIDKDTITKKNAVAQKDLADIISSILKKETSTVAGF